MVADACANPESFVRGGPTLTGFFFCYFFSLMRGGRIQIPLLAGHQANSADPDQMPLNVASDQGLHYLLIECSVKI